MGGVFGPGCVGPPPAGPPTLSCRGQPPGAAPARARTPPPAAREGQGLRLAPERQPQGRSAAPHSRDAGGAPSGGLRRRRRRAARGPALSSESTVALASSRAASTLTPLSLIFSAFTPISTASTDTADKSSASSSPGDLSASANAAQPCGVGWGWRARLTRAAGGSAGREGGSHEGCAPKLGTPPLTPSQPGWPTAPRTRPAERGRAPASALRHAPAGGRQAAHLANHGSAAVSLLVLRADQATGLLSEGAENLSAAKR